MAGQGVQGQFFDSERRRAVEFLIPGRRDPKQAPEQMAVSLRALLAAGAVFGVVFLWALVATGFIVFRDDFVTGMFRREASMQYDYEERISALKAEVARSQSKQLVDQEAFADKLDTLVRRQSSLESLQSIVQSLADIASTAGIRPPAGADPSPARKTSQAVPPPRPLPDGTAEGGPAPDDDHAGMIIGPAKHAALTGGIFAARPDAPRPGVRTQLASITGSLDAIEQRQLAALQVIGSAAHARSETILSALGEAGVDAAKLTTRITRSKPDMSSEGGPFIPLDPAPEPSRFETVAHDVQAALSGADTLNRSLVSIPLRRPFAFAEITSGFGARTDPFLGTAALHAGIDFREEIGAPVRATASGRVSEAGWTGGYGNMVEIDHGGGLSTRFGHMSEILVKPGDPIAIGQVVGRVGSTGRSTGPHLHYETRIDGVPVDPQRFLKAGQRIGQPG